MTLSYDVLYTDAEGDDREATGFATFRQACLYREALLVGESPVQRARVYRWNDDGGLATLILG
jgi:hypothetical protein